MVAIEDRIQNVSAVAYTSKAKKVISRFKYLGDERYAKYIGAMMRDVVEVHYRGIPFSVITSVPLHHKRLTERGFNQSQLLAEKIGKSIGIPTLNLLERNKPSPPQASLGRADRIRSLQNSFQISEEAQQLDLRPHTILLVDDVYTTGSTIRECAKTLRSAGAKTIYSTTFAR
jgi:competence protein ComFC